MSESHVVSGLVAKRSDLAGQIEAHRSELVRLQSAVAHLDYTIKLFAPEYDLRTIKAKRTNTRNQYFLSSEAQRITLDVMRETGRAMSSRELVEAILDRKGIEATATVIAQVQRNIIGILHRLEKRGVVVKSTNGSGGRSATKWQIV
ncbi:hypothetical protein [Methyloglobulus sp.]|uniref:hypothetical protein n=1 Tax=Methyloglobulus sp. TaxID=2518622 RepID=UPI003988EBA0